MQRRAACALSGLCAVLIASGVRAQEDPRDAQSHELQNRIESLERRLEQQAQPPAQQPTPQPAAPPRPPTPAQKQAATPATGPAEEETARALERTLVREGGLVLPRGLYELEPRLRYSYQGKEGLGVTSITGTAQVAQEVTRRDTWEASLGFRMGLPYAWQFEMRIPYVVT